MRKVMVLEITESALPGAAEWGLALLMRPAKAAPGVASVYARYADARTSASAIVAARWPGGSMRTSFADKTDRITSRRADAVNRSVGKIEILSVGGDAHLLEPV